METTTAPPARYECPRHGEHHYHVHIELTDVKDGKKELLLQRRYCTRCLIEYLDKMRINEMELIR